MGLYLNILKIQDAIRKSRVYLRPGEIPPKGIITKRGPNGGIYYETRSHSPKHAYDEINIAHTYTNLNTQASFVKQYILDELGQTKEAYKHIRNIEASLPKVREILENRQGKDVSQIKEEIASLFKEQSGYGLIFSNSIIGSIIKPAGRREHLKDPRDLDHRSPFKQLVSRSMTKNISGKNRYRDHIVRAAEKGFVDKGSYWGFHKVLSSKTTRDFRDPKKRGGWKMTDHHLLR